MKRGKPEHDSSLEEEIVHQKSKIEPKTPTRGENQEVLDMEEIRKMITELGRGLREDLMKLKTEVREDMKEIKENLEEMRKEIRQNKEDMKKVREEINRVRNDWEGDREELVKRLQNAESKIEKAEKDKIRNNLVVTGVETDSEETLRQRMEDMIEREIGIKTKVEKAYSIGQRRCIVEMCEWRDKIKVLKEKNRLKGKKIFIDAELTRREREVQRELRDIAREERNKGATVKVRYQKLELNGVTMKWDEEGRKLIRNTEGSASRDREAKN